MTPNNETENRKWSLPKLTMKETLLSTASVILTALFMPMFMYSSNCAEANLSELVMPMLLFSAMAVVMLFVLFLFTRSISKAALISVLMTLVLENYSFIEKCIRYVFPQLKYWHILPICIVVVLHIGYLLFRVLKEDIAKYVPFISTVVFGGLIVVNLVTAVPSIINKMSTDTLVSDDSGEVISDQNVDTNIYYFVLDEAASFKTLKNYYDYDAAEFRRFLEENHFNISENSYNESANTHIILTDVLNLNYVADSSMSTSDMNNLNINPTLRKILKQNGYSFYGVGDTEWLYISSLTENSASSSKTMEGEDILQLVMKNTFLYPEYNLDINETQKTILDTYEYYNGDVYSERSRFLMTYICSPHQPFIFDENGNSVPESHYADWSDEKYYLDQYKFIMKKTMSTVDTILREDPDSIIFIVSDHGPRSNPEMEYIEKTNILNCLYYKGETVNIEGLTDVETLRLVIEKLFDSDLPELKEIQNG